ncbi:DNA polymerase subunit Cdc27 [Endogone sp. FLAS-F59071]|nr:DNA polymerase subunit Cdc27 [Endogone sp. FLAS-F59071]|eukprot:RUS20252.1 DNA polymerase subunit Cdc27 [Endogone sp. FLAS-F59071]
MSEEQYMDLLNTLITYKWLSRRLKVHVNVAKQMLYEFSSTNTKSDSHATYCLCGFAKNNDQRLITLVPQEEIEAAKKKLKIITSIHIYSVQPGRPKDMAILAAANHDIPSVDTKDLFRLGVIRHPDLKINNHNRKSVSAMAQGVAPVSRTVSKPIESPKSISKTKSPMSSFFGKAAAMTPVKDKRWFCDVLAVRGNREESMMISSHFSCYEFIYLLILFYFISLSDTKTAEIPITRASTSSTSSKTGASSAKNQKEPAATAKNISDENKRPAEDSGEELQRVGNRKRKIVMEESDDSSDDEDSEEERDRRLAMSSRQAAEVDDSVGHEEAEEDEGEAQSAVAERDDEPAGEDMDVDDAETQVTSKRRRLKRKVLRKRHYKNARGFMVTEDVLEWESYSEDEPEPQLAAPQPAKQAAALPVASTSKGRGKRGSGLTDQKSLLSFWGKR